MSQLLLQYVQIQVQRRKHQTHLLLPLFSVRVKGFHDPLPEAGVHEYYVPVLTHMSQPFALSLISSRVSLRTEVLEGSMHPHLVEKPSYEELGAQKLRQKGDVYQLALLM